MHSKIFEISQMPLNEDGKISISDLEDRFDSFADYISDEETGTDREYYVNSIGVLFPFLSVKGNVVTLKDKQGLDEFLDDWLDAVKKDTLGLDKEGLFDTNGYRVQKCFERTHKEIYYRFYIHDWNDWAGPASDFVEWLRRLNEGDTFYIGMIVDFHN